MNFGGSDDGADGVCFVLQQISNSASGPLSINGAQIGYGSENPAAGEFNTNSMAIEIDTFANDGSADTGFNQTTLLSTISGFSGTARCNTILPISWQQRFQHTQPQETLKLDSITCFASRGTQHPQPWMCTSREASAKA